MIANAGTCTVNSLMDTTLDEWTLNMNVNALGILYCYRAAARQMIKQGRGGRLIGAASICGMKGNKTVAAYSASKFAVRGITQAAALEWAPHKITANCYSGGSIDTEMHNGAAKIISERTKLPLETVLKEVHSSIPLGYCGQPEDFTGLISFLASPASHYIAVSDVTTNEHVIGKSAIVTGASQGIGLAVAERMAQDGFSVILNDIESKSEQGLAAAKKISTDTGKPVIFMAGDVSVEKDVDALVEKAVAEFGGLDVMIANAGICTVNSLMDTTLDEWNLNMNVNALGVLYCYRSAARQMIKQGRGGRLIGASSVCAIKGNNTVAAYSASKFAMRGITQSAALEWAPHKITVNCYSGGCIDTEMHHGAARIVSERMKLPLDMLLEAAYSQVPLAYLGKPEDCTGLVSFLASPASHYITGQTIGVDGGWQMN